MSERTLTDFERQALLAFLYSDLARGASIGANKFLIEKLARRASIGAKAMTFR